jgi:hypothetical protein
VVSVPYLREQRRAGVIADVARLKFPFPNEQFPDLETVVNVPNPGISVGEKDGKPLFPHIVVIRRPGLWLQMMAEVEVQDTVTDESALTRWKPYAECGDLILYVPFGYSGEAKRLAKKHRIRLAGVRAWRYRPVWGLEVAEV